MLKQDFKHNSLLLPPNAQSARNVNQAVLTCIKMEN